MFQLCRNQVNLLEKWLKNNDDLHASKNQLVDFYVSGA